MFSNRMVLGVEGEASFPVFPDLEGPTTRGISNFNSQAGGAFDVQRSHAVCRLTAWPQRLFARPLAVPCDRRLFLAPSVSPA